MHTTLGWATAQAAPTPLLGCLRLPTIQSRLPPWAAHCLRGVVCTQATASRGSESNANMYRLGSVAAHRHQIDFYYRAATSPSVRTICEVGFNGGHSTAVWLAANPAATVESFDLFRANYSVQTLLYLQRRFPGRVVSHSGDSTRAVPAATLPAPCDLVHVDGRHSYLNVVQDFVNLLVKSREGALYLFDDQCDAANCTALWPVAGQPQPGQSAPLCRGLARHHGLPSHRLLPLGCSPRSGGAIEPSRLLAEPGALPACWPNVADSTALDRHAGSRRSPLAT